MLLLLLLLLLLPLLLLLLLLLLVLLVLRVLLVLPVLLPAGLSFPEKSTAEWFCPKDKNSVTLGLSFRKKSP